MAELEAMIKELDTAVAKIKEVHQKMKDMLKEVALEGNKLDKITVKTVKKKIPNTTKKTHKQAPKHAKRCSCQPTVQATGFATAEAWSKDPFQDTRSTVELQKVREESK
ncbi:hypothetical protein DSO57_1035685 [Entomophthora muscae]|uniref:Uncharacterized protein n=1 Tax=Entomophthora muscae TaxID=34485 RepID=A0ACC2UK46_9FUNG|nr:hypothetical protein DSO57_1035685 [Entomophthora muscae]